MIPRFFTPPDQSYFLFGPRGAGKSSFLKKHYPDAFWIDLLDPEDFRFFLSKPEKLAAVIREKPDVNQIVIDEVQRIPELLNVVHMLIEENKALQFILTGSSQELNRHKKCKAGSQTFPSASIFKSNA